MMANTTDVVSAIKELTSTKQLERSELIDLLKDGLHAALVKRYGPNVRAEIGIDEMKGSIRIVVLKTVVEAVEDPGTQVSLEEARFEDPDFQPGDVLEEEVPFEQFGRTAVQAAKQRIIQRVREGERSRIREEFSGKVGELLSGEVQQIERGKIVVMLNKFREAEAIIPYREQNHREHFHQGDTIRAVLKRIEETPKGPRLQAVVNELNGERIDIVPWSTDPERFAKLSLAPARVARVFSDPDTKTIQAIVDEDQLSLAIGRNGQNVRLASELTGWKIDLYSSREWLERGGEGPLFAPLPPEEEKAVKVALTELKGLPAELVAVLERNGKKTLQDILDLEREEVVAMEGMTPDLADRLMAFLNELVDEGGEEAPPAAAAAAAPEPSPGAVGVGAAGRDGGGGGGGCPGAPAGGPVGACGAGGRRGTAHSGQSRAAGGGAGRAGAGRAGRGSVGRRAGESPGAGGGCQRQGAGARIVDGIRRSEWARRGFMIWRRSSASPASSSWACSRSWTSSCAAT